MNTKETNYFEPNYFQRLHALMQGLRKPHHSREYKEACIELQRLSAPLTAILLPALLVSLLAVLGTGGGEMGPRFEIEIWEPDVSGPLDDPVPPEPPKPIDPIEPTFTVDDHTVTVVNPVDQSTVRDYSPQPMPFDSAIMTKSPKILKGFYGTRGDTGARGSSLARRGGTDQTEDAVLRTLRWLKLNQQPDGSWGGNRIAMTGLAVLTFLAHGETTDPKNSISGAEFTDTLQRALEYLISKQKADGRFEGQDGHDYSHPIATYALCEAYGMTLNPNVRETAVNALVPILKGQHPTGGWTYNMDPNAGDGGKYRDDTSYMGWCAQALKAAKLAHLPPTNDIDTAIKKAVRGFKANASQGGGFGYDRPGASGMTAVGTLCLQLMGAADAREVKLSLDLMKAWKPSFADKAEGQGSSLQYYHYYATQAKFHGYPETHPEWTKWNTEMKNLYLAEQKITKNAIKDMNGKDCDVGWWENKDNHTDRPVMDTCLAALQLMVYYRYLPTTKEDAIAVIAELKSAALDDDDVPIKVDI